MPGLDRSRTIAQLVLDHPACARVFRDHRIDFCCRGDMTVEDACAKSGLDAGALFAKLEQAAADRSLPDVDPRSLTTPALVRHLVSRHHRYLRETLPFAEQLARKVARVHGDHDPALRSLSDAVTAIKDELEPHLEEEERALFPALLARAGDPSVVARELRVMHEDHLRIGEMLMRLRELSRDYAVPDWACGSYRTLMRELEAIETDTFVHVHAETHVLMPRFLPLEAAS